MRAVKDILAARAFGNPGCPFCLAVAGKGPLPQVREKFRVHDNSLEPILAAPYLSDHGLPQPLSHGGPRHVGLLPEPAAL